jgi:hypothetical protein
MFYKPSQASSSRGENNRRSYRQRMELLVEDILHHSGFQFSVHDRSKRERERREGGRERRRVKSRGDQHEARPPLIPAERTTCGPAD